MLAPFAIGHFVARGMSGSQNIPQMPVSLNSGVSYFDGPAIVTCAAFSVHDGKLTEPVDCFDQPFWRAVQRRVAEKSIAMRRQGFFDAAMLSMRELEYAGITDRLERLYGRFHGRAPAQAEPPGKNEHDRSLA